jgi:hypothetical protein
MVTHLAGSTAGAGSSDGQGVAASFGILAGITVDHDGNVIVADQDNGTIRRVTPSGAVTTIAGLAGTNGDADGSGATAHFQRPGGVAVDREGNIYVTDATSSVIRKITPAGLVTTIAGAPFEFGSANLPGSSASFRTPAGIAVDGSGNLYVADSGNDAIRKITPAGAVTTLAGAILQPGSADGNGTNAQFNVPWSVAVDSAGNVYVSDSGNFTIRKITPDGTVSTLAGSPGVSGSADGTGSAASFLHPRQLTVDGSGNLYVADDFNLTIRKVTPAGTASGNHSSGPNEPAPKATMSPGWAAASAAPTVVNARPPMWIAPSVGADRTSRARAREKGPRSASGCRPPDPAVGPVPPGRPPAGSREHAVDQTGGCGVSVPGAAPAPNCASTAARI